MSNGSDATPSWLDFLTLLENDDGAVDRDALESERESCVRKLDELEDELGLIEDRFEDKLEQAHSSDVPNRYYRMALSGLHRFRQKQAKYEYVAQEYIIVSTLLIVADEYEDLHESTLDQSDELSDRQRDIAIALYRGRHIERPSSSRWTIDKSDLPNTFHRDQTIVEIQLTLRRDLDDSDFPSEYNEYLEEARSVSVPSLDGADYPNHEQKITWLEQIADVILGNRLLGVSENQSLPEDFPDFSDISVPDDDLPEDTESLSLEDDFWDI